MITWRTSLGPMILAFVLVGCALGLKPTFPPSFTEEFLESEGMTFTSGTPPSEVMSAEQVLAAVRGRFGTEFLGPRAVPTFGVLSCSGALDSCQRRTGTAVWLVIYPDLVGPGGAVGWVLVDAVDGLGRGYVFMDPRDP
jgi:hypothetical protein